MILVTGGTGFIGKALVRQLVENGYDVRLLIRPSKHSPDLPLGTPVEVAVSSHHDVRSLKVALAGIDTIYHLASAERRGVRGSLLSVDIQGTQALCQAAAQSQIKRIFFLSHLGADRASAFPLLKAKAIAEEFVRRSGVSYTILRSGVVFGKGDHFTTSIARLAHALPGVFFIPGDGRALLQPLWIEDLATCLTWAMDIAEVQNQTLSIGGPEFFPFQQIVQLVLDKLKIRRKLVHISLPYLNYLTILLENILPGLPTTSYWLDYLATNRTCSLDTMTRVFHILPSRFPHRLDHLLSENWRFSIFKFLRGSFRS